MSISLARQLARALDITSESKVRAINEALLGYVRLTRQSAATPIDGNIAADQVTSGQLADARISESSVTQHEAALEITELQISDLGNYPEHDDTETISGAWTFSQPLLGPAGAVGAPSWSFSLDPDTGMFRNGTNEAGFAAGGVLKARLHPNGWLIPSTSTLFIQEKAAAGSDVSGWGQLWVRSSDNALMYTGDDGTDNVVAFV